MKTSAWNDVALALAGRLGETGVIRIETMKSGRSDIHSIPVTAWLGGVGDPDLIGELGIAIEPLAVIGGVVEGDPAMRGGLRALDRVTHVDGEPVVLWSEFVDRVQASANVPLRLTVTRETGVETLTVTPAERTGDNGTVIGYVGAQAGMPSRVVRYDLVEAVGRALNETWSKTVLTVNLVRKMVTGSVSPSNLAGPISIAVIAGEEARAGLGRFLSVLALLSISFGVLNLMPVPLLDGGHVAYGVSRSCAASPFHCGRRRLRPKSASPSWWGSWCSCSTSTSRVGGPGDPQVDSGSWRSAKSRRKGSHMRKLLLAALPVVLWAIAVNAAQSGQFKITDIQLQGLQRVSAGTVFNILPVNVGDDLDPVEIRSLMRLLFESGYFDDIAMLRDGGVLIVRVVERPAIEEIKLEGNKAIKTEHLLGSLADAGLREGEIFKQATLEHIGIELERTYYAQGRYDAMIDAQVNKLPRNRVSILIDIDEGESSGVRHINVVGNSVFSQRELLSRLELSHPTWLSFIQGNDKYSREKMQGDLETLESYYQDRGYVEFDARSVQVSVTPDKKSVYITVNVHEGDRYLVDDVQLVGEISDVDPEIVTGLFLVRSGDLFNRAAVTATEERIVAAFGNSGYTFANATGVPEVKEDGLVDVKFVVEAGKRAYVRRINFAGNSVTRDDVLRRENAPDRGRLGVHPGDRPLQGASRPTRLFRAGVR